jgi:rubrerythrin
MVTGLKGDYKKGRSLLAEAMRDEKSAPHMYNKLYGTLKTKRDKKVVLGIIKQERRHLKKLKRIKRRIY